VHTDAFQGQLFSASPPAGERLPRGPDVVTTHYGPPVEIRTSKRRRKTIAAHWEGDTVVVVVPQRLSRADRQTYADDLVAKLVASRARTRPTDEALLARATALSARYLDGKAVPAAVTWSSRQGSRWGSCSAGDATIRLSDRLKGLPGWVIDAVLVHELAHLLRADHGPEFNALVDRYPRTADSALFLAGYAHGLDRSSEVR
jgi:predicted metal-dependent hydrolase